MSDETAKRVLELDELADPGPWSADEFHDILMGNGCVAFENNAANDWDAEFIAYTRTAAPELAREVIALRAELAQAREEYQNACALVARMHEAAMGEITGPVLGVVEDVANIRSQLAQAREALEQVGELAESITQQGIYPLKVDTILEITSDALRACAADTRNTDPASSGGG